MTEDAGFSPGKVYTTWDEAIDDHVSKIAHLDAELEAAAIKLCLACYEADVQLGPESRRPLIGRLEWSESRFSRYCSAGKMITELTPDRRKLLPNSSSTIYLLASLDADNREKAFEEGIVSTDMTRRSLESWAQQFKPAAKHAGQQKVLAIVYDPLHFTHRTTVIDELKRLGAKNSTKIMFATDKAEAQRERGESKKRAEMIDVAIKMYGPDTSLSEAKKQENAKISKTA